MAVSMSVYKIRDSVTGLFSSGNGQPIGRRWTKRGRVWGNKSAFRASLNYYLKPSNYWGAGHSPHADRTKFPETWQVVELTEQGAVVTDLNQWYVSTQGVPRKKRVPAPYVDSQTRIKQLEAEVTRLTRICQLHDCADYVDEEPAEQ